jgi:hypothetical protein
MAELADRRAFLRRGALAVGGTLGAGGGLAGCTAVRAPKPAAAPPFDPADWESVRAQFALARDQLDFSAFVFAAHPAYREAYVRFGPSIVTTPGDVDRVVRALAALR